MTKTQVLPGIEKYFREKHQEIPTPVCSPQKRRTFVARLLRYWLDHHPNEAARIVVAFVDRGGQPVELIGDEIYEHIVSTFLTLELQMDPHAPVSETQARPRHRARPRREPGSFSPIVYRGEAD